MINLNERMLLDRSRELTPSWSPVERASDWATEPGRDYMYLQKYLQKVYTCFKTNAFVLGQAIEQNMSVFFSIMLMAVKLPDILQILIFDQKQFCQVKIYCILHAYNKTQMILFMNSYHESWKSLLNHTHYLTKSRPHNFTGWLEATVGATG